MKIKAKVTESTMFNGDEMEITIGPTPSESEVKINGLPLSCVQSITIRVDVKNPFNEIVVEANSVPRSELIRIKKHKEK